MAGEDTNEILQRLTRVETKLDLMINARDIANEALHAAKASHRRLDEVRGDFDSMRSSQKWMIGILISGLGVFIAGFSFLLRLVGAE